jgi:uncharacterized protein (DUF885 family)
LVRALIDEYWDWTLREYPDFATNFGDHRYDDRLRDESAAAVAKRKAFYVEFRRRLADVDATQLPVQVNTSLQLLRFRLDRIAALDEQFGSLPFGPYDSWAPVTQMFGIHLDLPDLVDSMRFRTASAFRQSRGQCQELSIDRVAVQEAVAEIIRHMLSRDAQHPRAPG